MNGNLYIQKPRAKSGDRFDDLFEDIATKKVWNRLSVAVAYSSVAGVTRLHEVMVKHHPKIKTRWLLGLDDYITSPGVIEFCQNIKNSKTRIYKSTNSYSRFHPKFYMFEEGSNEDEITACVGSINLTKAAMSQNCEASALLVPTTKEHKSRVIALYNQLWRMGREPDSDLIRSYKRNYEKHRKHRSFLLQDTNTRTRSRKRLVLNDDFAEKSPDASDYCWIEVGKNTAMGRELEFKGEQARFFGLSPHGGDPEYKDFLVSDGTTVRLKLKFQGNCMWRLQMTRDVPEVAKGLRPLINGKLGRSQYVALFERTKNKNLFRLLFLREKSAKYKIIQSKSKKLGTIGHTTSRKYGWF